MLLLIRMSLLMAVGMKAAVPCEGIAKRLPEAIMVEEDNIARRCEAKPVGLKRRIDRVGRATLPDSGESFCDRRICSSDG